MSLQTATQIESDIRVTGGKTVVFGSESTYGSFGSVDRSVLEGDVIVKARVRAVRIATGKLTLSNSSRGATITVDGTDYTILDFWADDDFETGADGLVTSIQLGD